MIKEQEVIKTYLGNDEKESLKEKNKVNTKVIDITPSQSGYMMMHAALADSIVGWMHRKPLTKEGKESVIHLASTIRETFYDLAKAFKEQEELVVRSGVVFDNITQEIPDDVDELLDAEFVAYCED